MIKLSISNISTHVQGSIILKWKRRKLSKQISLELGLNFGKTLCNYDCAQSNMKAGIFVY